MLHVRAGNTEESLLMFDLSSVQGKCIKRAVLSLYSLAGSVDGGSVSRLVPKNLFANNAVRWKESSATWTSIKRITTTSHILKRIGRTRKNSWADIEVTRGIEFVDKFTFVISSNGAKAKYASRERSKYAPKLTLTLC